MPDEQADGRSPMPPVTPADITTAGKKFEAFQAG
jgi:hypothetical protein